ncbi:sporulation protein YabP [Clostridium sp. CAG:1013]|jgi:sporulation protein YabP|nr:sporulation protein YabP [Clostridium sp. CAG:1013]
MAEAQRPLRRHSLQLEDRGTLRATGIIRVDFFSEELITAQTDLGQLNIKGEDLHIESLDSDSGDLLARGKVIALSYTESGPALSFFGRLFK